VTRRQRRGRQIADAITAKNNESDNLSGVILCRYTISCGDLYGVTHSGGVTAETLYTPPKALPLEKRTLGRSSGTIACNME
jgi:hypothetical protein